MYEIRGCGGRRMIKTSSTKRAAPETSDEHQEVITDGNQKIGSSGNRPPERLVDGQRIAAPAKVKVVNLVAMRDRERSRRPA